MEPNVFPKITQIQNGMRQRLREIRNKAKPRYEKFSNETSMHGFLELYHAESIFWTILWFLFVVGAISMTIYQIFVALDAHSHQTSLTNIQPAKRDDVICPPLKFCITHWLYWVDWRMVSDHKIDKNTLLIGMSYLTNVYSVDEFNETLAYENFLSYMNLNSFRDLSEFYASISKPFQLNVGDLMFDAVGDLMFDKEEFMKTERYFCYKIDNDRIKAHLEMTKSSNLDSDGWLSVYIPTETPPTPDVVTPEEYYRYMMDWIWVEKPDLFSVEKQFVVGDAGYALPDDNLFANIPPVVLYADGYRNVKLELQPDISEYFIILKASAQRYLNRENKKCLINVTSFASDKSCENYCSACVHNYTEGYIFEDAIKSRLPTHPKSLTRKYVYFLDKEISDYEDYNYEDYKRLAQEVEFCIRREKSVVQKCIAEHCVKGCETWTYDATVITTNANFKRRNGSSQTLERRILRIKYPTGEDALIMTEVNGKTWQDLVSDVGGLLGIWTGASILSVCQLLYLCCCYGTKIAAFSCRRENVDTMKPKQSNLHGNIARSQKICV